MLLVSATQHCARIVRNAMRAWCLRSGACGSPTSRSTAPTRSGVTFDTSIHDRALGSFFAPADLVAGSGSEGVVYLGFPYGGGDPVVAATAALGLTGAPQLHLESASAITGMADINLAVHEAKAALVRFRDAHQLQKLHLFVRAPSHFAMALGHRLNGLGAIQLYDWVDTAYMPTATLS